MDVVRQTFPVTKSEFALVIGKLDKSAHTLFALSSSTPTIEFVNVAGTATIIHQTRPNKKSLPFPRTKLLTNLPSNSATYKLNNVRSTKKTLCPTSNRISLLRQPGTTTFSNRSKLRKNSRFTSTFLRDRSPPPLPGAPLPRLLVPGRRCSSTWCWEAAFCSQIAPWMRFARAAKRAR